MGKKKKTENEGKLRDDFTLKSIQKLGGDKEDYELLKNVDRGAESAGLDSKEDLDEEPIKSNELSSLIKELGIVKVRTQYLAEQCVEDGKKNKKSKKKVKDLKDEEIVKKVAKNKNILKKVAKDEETIEIKQEVKKEKAPKKKNKFKVQESEISSTTVDRKGELVDYLGAYKPRSHLLVKPGSSWFTQGFHGDSTDIFESPPSLVAHLKKYAACLYEDDMELCKKLTDSKKRSESSWMKTVLTSGTVADRSAALTLLVQDSPVQNLHCLDSLVAMVNKKGHRESQAAITTLKELFISDLLPDRRLRTFDQHPLIDLEALSSGNKDSRDKRLLLWYFEEKLKERYASFIQALKTRGQDNIQATKKKAIDSMLELLTSKPEQEQELLTMLVNKLGDQLAKTASYVVHLLNKLVEQHPKMKSVVVTEVERMLYRSHISIKAQYYAVCFLNQLSVSHREKELAAKLILVFFSFFKAFVKKGEVDSKILSALLAGVNRVYPYAKAEHEKIQDQLNTLYQITHLANFNTGLQALMLLYQVMEASDNAMDRYYQALYKKLLDPTLHTTSKQALFLNLVYKSLRKDPSNKRITAFIKRLLQVCCQHTPPFICGTLFLLSQVLSEKSVSLNTMENEYSDDDEDEHFTDVKVEESGEEVKTVKCEDGIEVKKQTSWIHRKNVKGTSKSLGDKYDPNHRNPLYCLADRECVWEIEKLTQHYHPSVSLFAKKLLKGEAITYSSDPLQDFTLIRFLDRFVYKNPKRNIKEDTVNNFMQSKRRAYRAVGVRGIPVNSDEFILKDEASIPEDEKFFHRFFRQQSKVKTETDLSDADSVSDEEFDHFLDKYEEEQGLGADGADFAGDFQRSDKKKQKGKFDSDSDDDLDLSDEDPEFSDFSDDEGGNFQEIVGDTADFDEEDVAFSDDDDTFVAMAEKKGKRAKQDMFSGGPSKKKSRTDHGSLFAAAEDFADIIEENMGDKMDTTGTEALSNKDRSDVKQLNWEMDRGRKLSGKTWKGKQNKYKKHKQKGAKRTKHKK